MSGFGVYVAAIPVRSTVKNHPACGAEQMSPARGLAPMSGNFLQGHVIATRTSLWDREDVDREANPVERLYLVFDLGGNRLCRARSYDEMQLRFGARREAQIPIMHLDAAPRASGHPMRSFETCRNGALVPFRARPNQLETVRQLGPVAQRAVEERSEPVVTPLGVQYPLSKLKRWAMADVLTMSARQLRYPVVLEVPVVSAHRSLHEFSVPTWAGYACFQLLYPVLDAEGGHGARRTRAETRLQRAIPTGRAGSRRPAGG
jgi:hypothetical protein